MSHFRNKENLSWVFTLFGTAVGAGILFLPIQAGLAGLWVTLGVSLLIYPTVYISQRFFAQLIYRSDPPEEYTQATAQLLGKHFAWCLRVLYVVFLTLLLIAYITALTNGIGEAITGAEVSELLNRATIATLVLAVFFTLLSVEEKWLLRALGALSLTLIFMLLGISIMLISLWDMENRFALPEMRTMASDTLQLFPLLVTSFLFFPALSSMVLAFRETTKEPANIEPRVTFIVRMAVCFLLFFSMFFVVSVFLAMSPDELAQAQKENISALTMLGISGKSTWLHELGPIISITALCSSFLGIALGYRQSLLKLLASTPLNRLSERGLHRVFYVFSFVLFAGFSVANIPVMPLLGEAVAPLCAIFLFFVPAIILFKHPERFNHTKRLKYFMVLMGLFLFSAYLLGNM